MKSVFISYDHDDQEYLQSLRSVNSNPNNSLQFIDRSLEAPIFNEHGHVNRRQPVDPQSQLVKRKISEKIEQSSKMLVLLGIDTHSSEWVMWEIELFVQFKGSQNILMMRVPNNRSAGKPSNATQYSVHDWDVDLLNRWLSN